VDVARDDDDDGDDGDAIAKGDDGFFFIVDVVDVVVVWSNAWWVDNDANHECDDSEGAQQFNDDFRRSGRTMERTRIDDGRHADARVVVDDGADGGGRRVYVQRWR